MTHAVKHDQARVGSDLRGPLAARQRDQCVLPTVECEQWKEKQEQAASDYEALVRRSGTPGVQV